MNIFKDGFLLVRWLFKLLRVFLGIRPVTTIAVVVFSVMSRITNLLAFFLPLKVILLAGSDGVPRYFRFFIDASDKGDWIIWLSVAAVVSYLLTLVLDAASNRLSEVGSSDILERANELALVGKERAAAHSYYAMFSEVLADTVFSIAVVVALWFINPLLLGASYAGQVGCHRAPARVAASR